MLANQCVSITDLRFKTKECLAGLWRHEKYVFINNKPVAVLVDIAKFEKWNSLFDFDKENIDQKAFVKYLARTSKKWPKPDRKK